MPNYNSILNRMPPNAVGRKRIQSVEKAVDAGLNYYATGLTWDPTTYKYTIAMTGASNVVGGSQQTFGNTLYISGSTAGLLRLYEPTSAGSDYVSIAAPATLGSSYSLV